MDLPKEIMVPNIYLCHISPFARRHVTIFFQPLFRSPFAYPFSLRSIVDAKPFDRLMRICFDSQALSVCVSLQKLSQTIPWNP